LGILATFGLVLWQLLRTQAPASDPFYRQQLNDLSDPDPLKRLIAVRELTHLTNASSPITASHLAECFRLILDRETEPLVCSALLDGLQQLNPTRHLEGKSHPVQFQRTQPIAHSEGSTPEHPSQE
jgi:hypothetical protein